MSWIILVHISDLFIYLSALKDVHHQAEMTYLICSRCEAFTGEERKRASRAIWSKATGSCPLTLVAASVGRGKTAAVLLPGSR